MVHRPEFARDIIQGKASRRGVVVEVPASGQVGSDKVLGELPTSNKAVLVGGGVGGNGAFDEVVVGAGDKLGITVATARRASCFRRAAVREMVRSLAFWWETPRARLKSK